MEVPLELGAEIEVLVGKEVEAVSKRPWSGEAFQRLGE